MGINKPHALWEIVDIFALIVIKQLILIVKLFMRLDFNGQSKHHCWCVFFLTNKIENTMIRFISDEEDFTVECAPVTENLFHKLKLNCQLPLSVIGYKFIFIRKKTRRKCESSWTRLRQQKEIKFHLRLFYILSKHIF